MKTSRGFLVVVGRGCSSNFFKIVGAMGYPSVNRVMSFGVVGVVTAAMAAVLLSPYPSEGAKKKSTIDLCRKCHTKVDDFSVGRSVHKPVKMGLCTSCHSPHAASHKSLLSSADGELCFRCHDRARGFTGEVVHSPVAEGKCLVCHSPHSSNRAKLLSKAGGEVCYACHPKEGFTSVKALHPEAKKGNCTVCHDPHASAEQGLLGAAVEKVCLKCHKSAKKLKKDHNGFKVAGTDCTSCHSPHSSDRKPLLKANLHKPFAEKKCSLCHGKKDASLLKSETELCAGCHEDSLETFNRIYSHLFSVGGQNTCGNCHNPHGSDGKNLIKGSEVKVCFGCHDDTEERVKRSANTHSNLEICSDCHSAHGSNSMYFMKEGVETCSNVACHESQGLFTHPVGEGIIDARMNSPMDCVTCHAPMGAPEELNLRGDPNNELCAKCHQM